MNGHWRSSWTHRVTQTMWLESLLPFEIPRSRVMSYGFPHTAFKFSPKKSSLVSSYEIAKRLLDLLSSVRREEQSRRPIIFLCHSTGGILLKRVLVMSFLQFEDIFLSVRCIAFFGTPHRGATPGIVSMGQTVTTIARLAQLFFGQLHENDALNPLSKNYTANLEELNDEFVSVMKISNKISVLSFYETMTTNLGTLNTKVVDKYSAILGFHQLETVYAIDSNHASLVKYRDADDPNYRLVLEQIKRITETLSNYSTLESRIGSYYPFERDDHRPLSELEEMKGLRADKWFENLKILVHDIVADRADERDDRIRVAVLDTGIDFDHPLIAESQSRIKQRKSFLPEHVTGPADTSDMNGHGTHVTHILMKTAPNADIYVGRIFFEGKEFEMEENADKIAEAIRHATTKWDVDIISMSWGGPNDISPIKDAIREAFYHGVTLFAAASNDGRMSNVAFPARMRQVICVNSLDGYGRPSNFNPPAKPDTNIAALGEFIDAAWPWPIRGKGGQTIRKAGTSMATPVAAAIGALILEYANQDDMEGNKVEAPEQLSHCDEIRRILIEMSREMDGFLCLMPGDLFYKKYRDRTMHGLICARINETVNGLSR
ncbi:hypothetical protein FOYG_16834 [Fusarium oxysporum NRRL 32931]|nr:hypothetical protein FOYG_16834 [Fusarium oxysporum NRRL 32931]